MISSNNIDFKQDLTWSGFMKFRIPKNEESMFKVEDIVFDRFYGWGVIHNIDNKATYPIEVKFENGVIDFYTNDGFLEKKSKTPSLSFTKYTISGFSQERPWEPEIPTCGEWAFFWDNDDKNQCFWSELIDKEKSIHTKHKLRYMNKVGDWFDNCSKTPPPHLGGK